MTAAGQTWQAERLPRSQRRRLRVMVAFLLWVMTGDLDNRFERRR